MADKKRTWAWCFGNGLIIFGDRIPSDAYAIGDGDEEDTEIIRRLAHKDGDSYWVPGIRDDRDWEDRIEMFADACNEHKDEGFTLVPIKDAERYHDWMTEALKKSDAAND